MRTIGHHKDLACSGVCMRHLLSNDDTYGHARCDTWFDRAVLETEVSACEIQKHPMLVAKLVHSERYRDLANPLFRDFKARNERFLSVHKAGDLFLRTPRGEDQSGKRQPGSLPQNKDHLDPPLGVLRLVLIGG